jgi:RNA 2',3'-cyclic 3'-phosphodiesterase
VQEQARAGSGEGGRRVRAFVAVPLPETLLRPVQRLCQELAGTLPQVRWVRPQMLHLTLRFFAAVPEDSLENIGEIMLSVGRSTAPFQLHLQGVGAFPSAQRPRVIWLGLTGDSPLRTLQRRLDLELARAGLPGEERPFMPHLTLGRQRGAGSVPLPAHYRTVDCGDWPVTALVLYESRLSPAGALHLPHRTAMLQQQ